MPSPSLSQVEQNKLVMGPASGPIVHVLRVVNHSGLPPLWSRTVHCFQSKLNFIRKKAEIRQLTKEELIFLRVFGKLVT